MSNNVTLSVATVVVLAAVVSGGHMAVVPVAAQDHVTTLLAQVRTALGGAEALAAVKAISVEGPYKRVVGTRSRESYVALLLVRPDKMRRSEESRFFTTTERVTTFDGAQAWDNVVTGGGLSGGSGGFDHGGGGGGAPPAPRPPPPRPRTARPEPRPATTAAGTTTVSTATTRAGATRTMPAVTRPRIRSPRRASGA
jgi:hypothetical protein